MRISVGLSSARTGEAVTAASRNAVVRMCRRAIMDRSFRFGRSDCETRLAEEIPPFGEHGARRTLCVAGRAELASFEAVEQAFGGEEAEAAFVSCDDTCGSVMDFDDVSFGHGCSFHGCSFAELFGAD